jgi:hypothetical protein
MDLSTNPIVETFSSIKGSVEVWTECPVVQEMSRGGQHVTGKNEDVARESRHISYEMSHAG